jgi:hypothetical protein
MHGPVRVHNALQGSLGLLHEVEREPHLRDQSVGGRGRDGIRTYVSFQGSTVSLRSDTACLIGCLGLTHQARAIQAR